MTDTEEILILIMEEAGEIIQEASKCIRRGETVSDSLIKEIGDMYTLINIMKEKGLIEEETLIEREKVKRDKLKVWSNLIDE